MGGDVVLWDVRAAGRIRTRGGLPPASVPDPATYCFAAEPFARLCFWTVAGLRVQYDLSVPATTPLPLKLARGVQIDGIGPPYFTIDGKEPIELRSAYFSSDDKYLAAVGSDRSVNVWRVQSGERAWRFFPSADMSRTERSIRSLAFGPDNRYLAAGVDRYARPGVNGAVIVWDMKNGKTVLSATEDHRIFQVAFLRDGDLICGEGAGGANGLEEPGRVTIRKSGKFDNARSLRTPCGVLSIATVPRFGVVTGDWHGHVLSWDTATGKQIGTSDEGRRSAAGGGSDYSAVVSLAASRDGKLVACGGLTRLPGCGRSKNKNLVQFRPFLVFCPGPGTLDSAGERETIPTKGLKNRRWK